jgi:hypothetical protein
MQCDAYYGWETGSKERLGFLPITALLQVLVKADLFAHGIFISNECYTDPVPGSVYGSNCPSTGNHMLPSGPLRSKLPSSLSRGAKGLSGCRPGCKVVG